MAATVTSQQIIASGALEAYLLGLTSHEDEQVVGELIADRPELADYLNDLDVALGDHFLRNAVPPPPALRNVLELQVTEHGLDKKEQRFYSDVNQQTHTTQPKPDYVDVEVDNTHIRVHKNWRPAFIAVFILSKIFLISALYYYFKADSQLQEILRLQTQINQTRTR